MSNTQIAKGFELLNPGLLDKRLGPYSTIEIACQKIPNTTKMIDGVPVNYRDGIIVLIGTNGSYTEYWWKGGFGDYNLTEYLGELVKTIDQPFIKSPDGNDYWVDASGYIAMKIDQTGKVTIANLDGSSTTPDTPFEPSTDQYAQVFCDPQGYIKKLIKLDGQSRTAPDAVVDWKALGDSITQFNDSGAPSNLGISKGYLTIVKEVLSITSYTNYGVAGTGIGQLYTKMTTTPQTLGIINTFWIGTNDWGGATTGGALPGTFEADYLGNSLNGSFAAKYRQIVDYVKANKPGSYNFLFTPMYRGAIDVHPEADQPWKGYYLKQYADIVISIAKYEGWPYLDLFYGGVINKANCNVRQTGVTEDGVHLNDEGYRRLSSMVVELFKKHIYQLNNN